jgi:hypothetical protein
MITWLISLPSDSYPSPTNVLLRAFVDRLSLDDRGRENAMNPVVDLAEQRLATFLTKRSPYDAFLHVRAAEPTLESC